MEKYNINYNIDSHLEASRILETSEKKEVLCDFVEGLSNPFLTTLEQAHLRSIIFYIDKSKPKKK